MAFDYFYDIPVYRLPQDTYHEEMNKHIDTILFPPDNPNSNALRELDKADPNRNINMRQHLYEKYGGCWRFNEVIGFIRLYFLGSQIRGEYYAVAKKRIVRTRTKIFEYREWKLAPEVDVSSGASNNDIFQAVLEYLSDCRKELKGRYIDTALFERVGSYIDWRRLLTDAQQSRHSALPPLGEGE